MATNFVMNSPDQVKEVSLGEYKDVYDKDLEFANGFDKKKGGKKITQEMKSKIGELIKILDENIKQKLHVSEEYESNLSDTETLSEPPSNNLLDSPALSAKRRRMQK